MVDLKEGKGERSLVIRKCQSFLCPESEWTQACSIPVIDVPLYSTKPETEPVATPGNVASSSSHYLTQTDASSSKPVDSSVSRYENAVQQSEKSSSVMTNGLVSERKRKILDRDERKERSGNIKRARTRLTATASGFHDAKTSSSVSKVQTPVCHETDMMRYGRMLGYNVVSDYNSYIVVRSAYGYGNISQASAMTRNLESVSCSQTGNSIRQSGGKTVSPEDRDNQMIRTERRRIHHKIDLDNYLVVQSVAGYGNISQSGGAKRIIRHSHATKVSLNSTSKI